MSIDRSSTRHSKSAPWRHVDLTLLLSVLAIIGLGLLMIYSATHRRLEAQGLSPAYYLQRQGMAIAAGLALMAAIVAVDYRVLRDRAPILYLGTVGLLLFVLSPLGRSSKGSQAWFQLGPFQAQPSELAKVALIVCLASYVSMHRGDLTGRHLLTVLGLAAVPMALIQAQPDLGTNLVFGAILMGMLLVAGAKSRHLLLLSLVAVFAVVAAFQLGVVKDYQRDRLSAFLDAQSDVQRSAYNLNQSKIAIGSGGLTGKGLFKGTQTNLSYVPEQHTDFIFTVVGEELGLAGSALLLMLFAVVVWRTWRAAALARDLSGTLICTGILAMFVFQIFENVGMTMGIMPITGIPLPFMSYGGSATITNMAAIGLVLSVHMHRFS